MGRDGRKTSGGRFLDSAIIGTGVWFSTAIASSECVGRLRGEYEYVCSVSTGPAGRQAGVCSVGVLGAKAWHFCAHHRHCILFHTQMSHFPQRITDMVRRERAVKVEAAFVSKGGRQGQYGKQVMRDF